MLSLLPAELLQHIYSYLDPLSFQAVRQTCLHWRAAAQCNQTLRLVAAWLGWSVCLSTCGTLSAGEIAAIDLLLESETRLAGLVRDSSASKDISWKLKVVDTAHTLSLCIWCLLIDDTTECAYVPGISPC